jgi:dTDP-4-amino-4,6-dideoxygalactose transaminase
VWRQIEEGKGEEIMDVNFVDLPGQYRGIKQLVLQDVEKALDTGGFMGSEDFEQKFAEYHGSKYCVGVGSGTDALLLALLAAGVEPGDEVIVPANTYIATAFAVSHAGAIPVFVDPDPETYTMGMAGLHDAITEYTRAIIPVHLYGYPADMHAVMAVADTYDLLVIEDCAQSAGAVFDGKGTGTFGDAGCYSFYPAKNLGGLGQGGAVVTDNEDLARVVRELGNVGRSSGSWFDYDHIGYNSRLDALNAKFLSHCLDKLDLWNESRRAAADIYDSQLMDIDDVITPPTTNGNTYPVFHLYELKCHDKKTRDDLKAFLGEKGIPTGLHYPKPCHLQSMYIDDGYECPISEELSDTLLSLPMHPKLMFGQIKFVCDSIKEFFNGGLK